MHPKNMHHPSYIQPHPSYIQPCKLHPNQANNVHWMPEAAVGVLTGLAAATLCKATGQIQLLADVRAAGCIERG